MFLILFVISFQLRKPGKNKENKNVVPNLSTVLINKVPSVPYPFLRVFVLALKGVRSGYPIALDSPWRKGYVYARKEAERRPLFFPVLVCVPCFISNAQAMIVCYRMFLCKWGPPNNTQQCTRQP